MNTRGITTGAVIMSAWLALIAPLPRYAAAQVEEFRGQRAEVLDDPYLPNVAPGEHAVTSPAQRWIRGAFESVQVNVDAFGDNIVGDAANEPSIAIDPTDHNKMAIGWRQFDTIASNFRQAGVAYSDDGGQSWTFPGVLDPGQFRSDPILAAGADGTFYYYSLSTLTSAEFFISQDGGITWGDPIPGFGGDKAWMVVDATKGIGQGNVYAIWNRAFSCCNGDFTRSTDGGQTFEQPFNMPTNPFWGTLSVGPESELYISGNGFVVLRSDNARNPLASPSFNTVTFVDLTGFLGFGGGPNPAGLLGQAWVATDHSDKPSRGNVYLLASVDPPGADPLDVMFARSTDRGETWSSAIRVNDDPNGNGAWQWFGTMSVAPNGRIDVVFNDTRNGGGDLRISELFYTSSTDAGLTWSRNTPVSPSFNSHVGWPQQNKLGDYYHMVSDNAGASLAYAATFNGEQDVYFLRISADCNDNGIPDDLDIAEGRAADCNQNDIPDDCDIAEATSSDCSANGIPDECEPDLDADGFVDLCDNCPSDANADQTDTDGDGKGDACDPCPLDNPDDRDLDGACDADDECPVDPNKVVEGACGCGVADFDDDGDGVAECNDLCPGVDDGIFAPECVGAIPTVSAWGMIILALLLITAAKIRFGRGRLA